MRPVKVEATDVERSMVRAMLVEHLRTCLAAAQFEAGEHPSTLSLAIRVRKIVTAYEALRNGNGGNSFTLRMRGKAKARSVTAPELTLYPIFGRGSKGPNLPQ